MALLRRLLGRVALLACGCATVAHAQPWREAAAQVRGSARVLFIGTRPEDDDNALVALLARGRQVETAYLSLTRGESGVNVSGSERGAPLAVVRTAELLAARQRDGGRQYFTRAFDIGAVASDSVVAAAWPRDSLLIEVTAVVRAFRPQVIIALVRADTTERDATRRFTARLAAAAFALAGDTVALPRRATSQLGAWVPSRLFTRVDSVVDGAPVIRLDVGAFDRATQRSYAELGAEIRRLQRTQPPQAPPPLGRVERLLRRDSVRGAVDGELFAASDTSFARLRPIVPVAAPAQNDPNFRAVVPEVAVAQFDTLQRVLTELAAVVPAGSADTVAVRLARVAWRANAVRRELDCPDVVGVARCDGAPGDLAVSLNTIRERATRAMLDAAGLVIDAVASRELVAAGDSVPVTVTLRNGGGLQITIRRMALFQELALTPLVAQESVALLPDSTAQFTANLVFLAPTYHWWQINGLVAGTQLHAVRSSQRQPLRALLIGGEDRIRTTGVQATLGIDGVDVPLIVAPVVARGATALRGDMRHPVIGVPEASLLLERGAEYERAGLAIDRLFRVFVTNARSTGDTLQVSLDLPRGLRADSTVRTVALPPFGSRNLFFRLRGAFTPGQQVVSVSARSVMALPAQAIGAPMSAGIREFTLGTVVNDYPHIPSQHFVRFARDRMEAVDLRVPATLRIGYVRGTEDLRVPLTQLRLQVVPVELGLLPAYDLAGFSTLLLGAGALRGESAVAAVPALQAFLARGGTVVVLNGGAEVARSGLFPYPLAIDLAGGRAANDSLDVRITDARSPVLTWPNAITSRDWMAWQGDRTCGRASMVDSRYRTPMSVLDPGATTASPAIIAAAVGKGTLIHTSLCIGPEMEGARAGAARVLANLLGAGLRVGR